MRVLGADLDFSRVCGGKRFKFLVDVDIGFLILLLVREIWLKVSVGREVAAFEVRR